MDEPRQSLSLTSVEINIPLDFLAKAVAYADYDADSRLLWNAEGMREGENCPYKICSSRTTDNLVLHFEHFILHARGKQHVCDIGEPVLQETPPCPVQKSSCYTGNTWQTIENDKQTQTVVTFKSNASDMRISDICRKRKVGRPKKVPGKLMTSENNGEGAARPCITDDSLPLDRLDPRPITTKNVDQSLQTEAERVSNSVEEVQRKSRRYGLRGVKLNSNIMGAVKGIEYLSEEQDGNSNDAAQNDTVPVPCEDENILPSGHETDSENENYKKGKESCASNSKYTRLNEDWIPKRERRPRRAGNVKCKLCKKKLSDYTGVYEHVKKKHFRKKGVTAYLEELSALKAEKCKICGVTFSDRKKLMFHEDREHAETGPVTCRKCGNSFKSLLTLRTHIRAMHLQEPSSNLCHLCSASFKSTYTLKQHIDQVHLGNKYFQCDICSKKFYNGSQLRRHCKTHNWPESQKHVCPTCGKRFIFAYNLKKHITVVHSAHKEAFHCPYCGKGFGQKAGMLSHIQLVHFNIFPYSCKECKATFARSVMLIEHMKSYHKVPDFQVTEKAVKNGIYNKTAEDMFYCSYCKEGFLHKTKLVEHMHTDHSKAFPFKCETCNQGFLEKSFLVMHKMKAHGILITDNQQEDFEQENNEKHEILQVITTKEGYPNKIIQLGLQNSAEYFPAEQETVELGPVLNGDDATAAESGTTDSAQDSTQSSSYLLMEVESGDGTCRYVIQAPGLLEEGGASSTTVAQDIANLLLAAEQVSEDGGGTDGTTEISLVIDGTQETVQEDNSYTEEDNTDIQVPDNSYPDSAEVEPLVEEDTEVVEGDVQIQVTGTEGEIQVITLPNGDLDLLQLAAMETVNVSEEQEEEGVETGIEATDTSGNFENIHRATDKD